MILEKYPGEGTKSLVRYCSTDTTVHIQYTLSVKRHRDTYPYITMFTFAVRPLHLISAVYAIYICEIVFRVIKEKYSSIFSGRLKFFFID